ncbi:phage protein Gp27 family protein [Pararoseomonas sp. SCSIO 73927]|uniref:phage protein Gp27 family protein n=1 Tax=Pararoseomonas sp. SCSIO 73927 TaxID=3114537 RepID=UPI0030D59ABE
MGRPSSVDRLGPEIREQIGRLLDEGRSLDEIMAHLASLEVREISRSALGRYTQRVNKLAENRRRAEFVAQALERDFGSDPENKLLRHLIKSVEVDLFDILNCEGEEGEDAPKPDAKSSLTIAQTLERLVRTSRHDAALRESIEKRAAEKAKREAAASAEEAGQEAGLSGDMIDKIKRKILGLKAAP